MANREALVRGWHDSEVARHDDGLLVLQERAFDFRASRDLVRYTLLDSDGRRATREASIRLYTLTELEAMLGRAAWSCWPSSAAWTAAPWSWTRASS